MKQQTALRNLENIVGKVRGVNGIYTTPLCDREFVKIKRMWVFGSVAKGSATPNDLDVFIELRNHFGQCDQPARKARRKMFRDTSEGVVMHGGYKKRKPVHGMTTPVSSTQEVLKWLKKGTRKTSIHIVGCDRIFDRLDCKYLVYPRNDFKRIGGY